MSSKRPAVMTSCTARFCLPVLLALLVTGCANHTKRVTTVDPAVEAQVSSQPVPLHSAYRALYSEGERNAVLNYNQLGVQALEQGLLDHSREAFESSLTRVEQLYGNHEGAEKARSLWYQEAEKDFRGEPYERAMAYYYQGLLDLIDTEYQNAHAAFSAGILQDAYAEEEQHRADFALLMFLNGWTAHLSGQSQRRDRDWKELTQFRPDFPLPKKHHNTLVIIETGRSPRKLADGVGHYELVYRRGKRFTEKQASVVLSGKMLTTYPMEDIFWQASTRGGRAVDRIVKGKAKFRSTNQKIGSTLSGISQTAMVLSPLASESGLGDAAAAIGVISTAQLLIAANVDARADTRYWNNLPDTVHVKTLKTHDPELLDVQFQDEAGKPVSLTHYVRQVFTDSKGNHLVWFRSRPSVQASKTTQG